MSDADTTASLARDMVRLEQMIKSAATRRDYELGYRLRFDREQVQVRRSAMLRTEWQMVRRARRTAAA